MSESSPPPSTATPPKSGSGGFIAIAIIMLLGMGGLIFWKLGGDKDTEVVEKKIETAPPQEQPPKLEAPPPPPPTEEELEEEKEPEKKEASTGNARPAGPSGCAGACQGTLSAEGMAALRGKGGQARGCYQHALRLNPTLSGKMTVAMRISPSGQVCGASITNDSLGDPSVANCVAQMFRAGKYPAPQGGCVDTAVPLNFVTKK